MSDPKHFDTILPFLQPLDVPHRIDLTSADIKTMYTVAEQDVDFLHPTSSLMFIRGKNTELHEVKKYTNSLMTCLEASLQTRRKESNYKFRYLT